LYHYLRQKLHRPGAVLLSALLFGILHMNWAGFLPLMLLGALLALAYEWTGDIRVSIMTHALFNFTTVMMLFLGVPQPS
jgi:membrane protease YdiL (CAAX protease family)